MAKRSGLVHEPEMARPHLKPGISAARHQEALETCRDVPEMRPAFNIALDQAGISSKTVWINLPQGRLPFDAEIMVDLPGAFRGIHMSRMERAVSDLYDQSFEDIRFYSESLCRLVLSKQRGNAATVSLSGKIPQVTRTAVSGEVSTDAIEISTQTTGKRLNDEVKTSSFLGLSVTHITACPCTGEYNRAMFQDAAEAPLPTHSQRCITTIQAEDRRGAVSFQDLYECLSSSLHLTQDLLKRPDEAEIVLKCHKEPQFAEDVVRQAAFVTGRRLKDLLPPDSRIRIETISLESIHLHNVKCVLDCTLGQIIDNR